MQFISCALELFIIYLEVAMALHFSLVSMSLLNWIDGGDGIIILNFLFHHY